MRFEREWNALRAYARERGIRLIGDVPIYVSDDGADVEAWPELFEHGEVAGAPPDALNANGQHWGNPLYDWPAHRATGYRWWIERFRRVHELVDLSRIDHFRGFVSYWAVPGEAQDGAARPLAARPGQPSSSARSSAASATSTVIAEDLGVITPAVHALRDELGLPGHGRAPLGVRPARARIRTHPRTTASTRSSTRARTTPTRPSAGSRR